MKDVENIKDSWTICEECQGRGKKSQRLRKKAKLRYKLALDEFEKTGAIGTPPD